MMVLANRLNDGPVSLPSSKQVSQPFRFETRGLFMNWTQVQIIADRPLFLSSVKSGLLDHETGIPRLVGPLIHPKRV